MASGVRVTFLPDNVTVMATAGEAMLTVAKRAGVEIPTGCLMGSCHACEVELGDPEGGEPTTVCACISAIPGDRAALTIDLAFDPSW
ncbi:MAG: 2Fe-2S iron-sulfur cluster-binding protein [Cyanobacteria bacterium]|nr:2Fe-2S iron-sulfur cluster-binding protein [Cyanobacteriota bacterium]